MFLPSSSSTNEGCPNNPSTSSSFLHLTNSSDELGQSHHSSFSIRDYACNYRTKNIQKSWPLASTSLQLCLKHGLSDPLPPMQPLNSLVRHPPEASSSKKQHIALVEAISCKRKFEKLGSNQGLAETKQGFENGSLASGSQSKIQVANANKNPRKKCGLIVNPGACVDSESKEDSGQQPGSKPRKPVKPRMKVKMMVDLYATAKECTLEDLDKINGTKWAVISDKHKPEVCNKRKKLSVLPFPVDEDAAGIGPVYIDAKGQKLRNISEFNEKASHPSREHVEDVSEKISSKEGKGNYRSFRKRLGGKKYYKHCKGNALEILECRRGYSEEFRGMEREGPTQCRIKKPLGRNICDQPYENGHSLSANPNVSRGPRHASVDYSETVSSPLNSQHSWRSFGESQVSGKITKVFASKGKGVMKLKKAWLENEEEDEDSGRWESEMTQEHVLTDYNGCDDNKETDTSTSGGGEGKEYERWEETGNNIGDGNMLEKNNDADAEFESMVYERTGCETAERGGSTFMEVDDPIPIPGPPGSFLQSPWDMETDASEHHGNFLVIASHVKSSQDQVDLTDGNSSESTFGHSAPHMIQQDLSLLSKSVPAAPSTSNSVLRLMGKDLMVINQREET
ncbi:hypothetical protein Bca101_010883 [Brassica carinata]